MKIVHISASDSGGAGLAAYRLNEALVNSGTDSTLLCNHKTSKSKNVVEYKPSIWNKVAAHIILMLNKNTLINRFIPNYFDLISCPQSLFDPSNHPLVQQADIINLHWLGGTINYKDLFQKIKKPIVWTLHDMNPFMGEASFLIDLQGPKGCHLLDREKRIQQIKQKIIRNHGNITIVNLCEWMKKYSSSSETFRDSKHTIIRNSLDIDIFKPYDKQAVRKLFGLSDNANVFMFGCQYLTVKRKGMNVLLDTIKIRNNPNDIYVVFGEKLDINVDSRIIHWGTIKDERLMAMAYSAADAFLLPSLEDNLPNSMLESLCCGTPVISFTNGGMTDIIEDGKNGYLVEPSDAEHLASAIEKFIHNKSKFNRQEISEKARQMFAPEVQAKNYISLYQSIIQQKKK